jgi:hypothetical protein
MLVLSLLAACGRLDFASRDGVAVDSTGTAIIAATNATAIALDTLIVGAGPDECLVAGLVLADPRATEIVVAWNGVALATVVDATVPGSSAPIFVGRLIAPASGAHALTATWTGGSDAILGAVSFSGADQLECVRAVASAEGSSATPAVTIPSAARHVTMDVAVASTMFETAAQSLRGSALAEPTPTLVQQTTHAMVDVTTDTCTLAAPPTPGNNLVFIGAIVSGAIQAVTGAGVSWKAAASSNTNANEELWYGEVTTGTGTTITYTTQIAGSSICWVGEFAGLARTGSLDAAKANFGGSSPAAPGLLVTAAPDDLLLVGYATGAVATWGSPTAGPWTTLAAVANSNWSQLEFSRQVATTGSWNPSIDETSTTFSGWDAAAAAFEVRAKLGAAISTAAGAPSTTHAWMTDLPGAWGSVGLDVSPP